MFPVWPYRARFICGDAWRKALKRKKVVRMISIVTPVYNSENYIEETIKSVLEQSYTDWEWILVDDGSADRSAEIIEQYNDSRIRLIRQKNKGAAAARNRGIEAAKGRYIAFLDADDIWDPNKLTNSLQYM